MSDFCKSISKRPFRKRDLNALQKPEIVESLKKRQCRNRTGRSLLELDDDCLCIVLEHLDVDSLSQMANVCKRIRPLTEEVFHRRHKKVDIQNCHEKSVFRRILLKFGHAIRALHLTGHHCNIRMPIDMKSINEYCSNVQELHIYDFIVDCEEAKPVFARVSILTVKFCQLIGDGLDLFSSCASVQKLVFSSNYSYKSWCFLATAFPSLKEMAVLNDFSLVNKEDYINFLMLNPQLEKLTMRIGKARVPPLPKYATNLKNLHLIADRLYGSNPFRSGKTRYMNSGRFDSEAIREIAKMKNLEVFSLGRTSDNSETDFIHLITELPLLTRFDLNFEYEKPTCIILNCIKRIIELGNRLDCLRLFGIKRLRIDQEVFEMLLKAVKSNTRKKKINIFITGCRSKVKLDVPKVIQQAAEKYLEIFLNKDMKMDGSNRCMCKWCERKNIRLPWQDYPYV